LEGPDPSHLTKWDQQYEDASLDFHYSLNTKEKVEIYLAVLRKENKMLVHDSLFNSAGTMYTAPEDRKSRKNKMFYISIEKEVKQAIEKFWIRKHLKNKFISNLRDYAIVNDNRTTEFKDHYSSVKLGPIKNIKGEIIVGFETYTDPLASLACKYQLKKKNGKWIVVDTWGPHAIS
ncbi:MAG: hypothetical protein Q8940_20770, partial [Bacteroidota bacterium]|nr:hypothetical protein [Bacteroidota bacterium]